MSVRCASADELNTTIQDHFIRVATEKGQLNSKKALADLKKKTFGGWPAKPGGLRIKKAFDAKHKGVRFAAYDFDSQKEMRLRMYVAHHEKLQDASTIHVEVLGVEGWHKYLQLGRPVFAKVWDEELKLADIEAAAPVTDKMRQALEQQLAHVREHPKEV